MRMLMLASLLAALLGSAAWADDPKQEYEKRVKKLKKGDVQSHMQLAAFCMENGLMAEAKGLVETVLKINPKDQGAKGMLQDIERAMKEGGKGGPPGGGQAGGPPGGGPPGGGPPGGGPPGRSGPASDPGLTAKTKEQFKGDGRKIGEYVDQVYNWGLKLFNEGKHDDALKYWAIIEKHYPEAEDKIELIKAYKSKARQSKTPSKGGDDGFGEPPRFGDDDDEGDETPPARPDPVPGKPGDQVPGKPGDQVPGKPGDQVPGRPGNDVPKPPGNEVPKPEITGPDKPKDPKKPDTPPPDADDPDAEAKKEADKYKRHFKIKSFRRGSNATFGGNYPELQLVFECTDSPKYVTLVFSAYSKDGKVFKAYRTIFGPDANTRHAIVAAYKKEWVQEFGNLTAGRIEICAGTRKNHVVMVAMDCDEDKAPKAWWNTEEPQDYLGFYKPGQNPFETNTLKAVKK